MDLALYEQFKTNNGSLYELATWKDADELTRWAIRRVSQGSLMRGEHDEEWLPLGAATQLEYGLPFRCFDPWGRPMRTSVVRSTELIGVGPCPEPGE